jgi:pimeloyl-ACP methyl ester carboxylesterase
MKLKIPALIGGAVGVVTAAAAAGLVHEHRVVEGERARIDPRTAALLGALPVDRESRVRAEDGIELHVEEVGPLDAPLTVVFVHGFGLTLGSFHFQRLALSEHFGQDVRLVLYDQRSHGRSDRSAAVGCTIEQLGRDLGAVIDSVVPNGPIVLIGHSMGGMTVMALASQRPDLFQRRLASAPQARIGSVGLINTSSGDLKTVTLGLPSFVARIRGPVLPVILRRAARSADLVERGRALGKDLAWVLTKRLSFGSEVDPAVVAYCTNMIAATRVDVFAEFYPTLMAHDGTLGLMNLVDCSVLVLAADHDALTPLAHAETIAAALPFAELIVVADAGHLLMLEHPDEVDRPVLGLVGDALSAAAGSPSRIGRTVRRRSRRAVAR